MKNASHTSHGALDQAHQAAKTPVIRVEKLEKTYDSEYAQTQALRGIDLTVNEGDFVAIIGPSGSGKSTLMNILGCLDVSSNGLCEINGFNTAELSSKELARLRREQIGFVFQSFYLQTRMNVLRNVMLPMVYSHVDKKNRVLRAQEALRKAEVDEKLWTHKANELSGGQMQRVAIARSLVNEPRLILADEPTGNLDTQTSERILALFQQLNNDGRTIVLITHEPEIAAKAKRIVRIQDGLLSEVSA